MQRANVALLQLGSAEGAAERHAERLRVVFVGAEAGGDHEIRDAVVERLQLDDLGQVWGDAPGRGTGGEEDLVGDDLDGVREVERGELSGGGDGDAEPAVAQLARGEAGILAAEEDRDLVGLRDGGDLRSGFPKGRRSREDSSAAAVGGPDEKMRSRYRRLEICDNVRCIQDFGRAVGAGAGFRSIPPGCRRDEGEPGEAHGLHRARCGADVPGGLRLHEEDADTLQALREGDGQGTAGGATPVEHADLSP
jgi:hypothetical protein